DAAQRGDRPQPAWPAQREPVEAPREEDDAQDEEPPGRADPGPARLGHGDGDERERVVHLVPRADLERGEGGRPESAPRRGAGEGAQCPRTEGREGRETREEAAHQPARSAVVTGSRAARTAGKSPPRAPMSRDHPSPRPRSPAVTRNSKATWEKVLKLRV